jgi:hypothetical protein
MALFEKHKILFSLLVSLKLEFEAGAISQELWEFFTEMNIEHDASLENPFPDIPQNWWQETAAQLSLLREIDGFEDIHQLCFEEHKDLFL